MSTIKSSAENLTLNADGANNDIKFQSNGSEVASIDQAGLVTAGGVSLAAGGTLTTVSGNDLNIVYPDSRSLFIKEAGTTHVAVDNTGKVGIGETVPLAKLHVKNADSGVTSPDAGYDDMVVENSADVGISLLSTDTATIAFNDANGAPDGSLQYRHDDRSMRFAGAGAERMRIHSNGVTSIPAGVALGVGTANTASNTLDDYEEGTWTPVMKDTADRALSTNTGSSGAIYVKIGRQVTVTGRITTDSVGSASGQLVLTGLPFAAYGSSLGGYSGGTVGRAGNLNIASGTNIAFAVSYNQTFCEMTRWDDSVGTTDMQVSEWSADGWIMFCLVYQT